MPVCMKPNFMSNMAAHASELHMLMVYRPMRAGANEGVRGIGKAVHSFPIFSFHDGLSDGNPHGKLYLRAQKGFFSPAPGPLEGRLSGALGG